MRSKPIYILSKGRPTCMTAAALDTMDDPADFLIVCGDDDDTIPEYERNFGRDRVVVFDHDEWWQRSDMMDAYGRDKASGIAPVRNFIVSHARGLGLDRCWELDDDIAAFMRVTPHGVDEIRNGGELLRVMDAIEQFARLWNVRTVGFTAWKSTPKMCLRIGNEVCTIHNTSTEGMPYRGRIFEDAVRMFDSLRVGEVQYHFKVLAGVTGNDWYGRKLSETSLDGGMREQYDDIAQNDHGEDGVSAVNIRNVGYATMALPMANTLTVDARSGKCRKRYHDRKYRPKVLSGEWVCE